ncbi:MAG: hypothetical protein WCP35_03965 [Verrucomicrobiota bacterium]
MPAKKVATSKPAVEAPEKMPAAKKTATKTPPAKKTVAKKSTTHAAKTAGPAVPAEPAAPVVRPTALAHPTRDQIAHSAYLNFQRRKHLGLAGDAASDWLEAERQLGLV